MTVNRGLAVDRLSRRRGVSMPAMVSIVWNTDALVAMRLPLFALRAVSIGAYACR